MCGSFGIEFYRERSLGSYISLQLVPSQGRVRRKNFIVMKATVSPSCLQMLSMNGCSCKFTSNGVVNSLHNHHYLFGVALTTNHPRSCRGHGGCAPLLMEILTTVCPPPGFSFFQMIF